MLGQRMRARRKKLGLTLRGVAALLGVSVSYVHDLETEKRALPQSRILGLAVALGVPTRTLERWAGVCTKCHGTGCAA